jgi:coenzyme F420-dependent glucose-6-phosphate dehydrogenase
MYPGRVFVGLGSGESLNESPFGLDWPPRDFQLAALEEACGLIRRLWDGERVDHDGRFFKTKRAYLHTRPDQPPRLYISAFHAGAAAVAGRYGDGLWTFPDPEQAPKLIATYRETAAEAGRGPGTIVLEAAFSWAPDDADALEAARVWTGAVPDEFYTDDWFDPQAMYERGDQEVSDEDFKQRSIISADPDEHVERIKQLEQMVAGDVVVKLSNQSGPNALEAIRIYGERVLPKLRG